jgi:replicative DNA helicase
MDQLQRDKNPDIANQVIEQLMALRTSRKKAVHTIDEVMTSVLERMDRAHKSGEFVGVKSGITDVDHVLGGFHNSDLVVIAARPAVGKTAMALNFANSAANNKWVAVYSCEQGHEQIGSRLVSIEGAINSLQVRNVDFKDHEWAFLTNAVELVRKKKIIIVDRSYPKIAEIISTARQLKYEHDIKAIYVDYLQIIESSRTDIPKHEQTGQVVRALKALALELDIPVVVLAQVRREVDSRTDKRPMQGDISDSSEIEKTADVIMTLYRDEAYDPKSNQKGVAEIVVCKNRHGPTGVVHCAFIGKFMQFKDLAHTSYLNSEQ